MITDIATYAPAGFNFEIGRMYVAIERATTEKAMARTLNTLPLGGWIYEVAMPNGISLISIPANDDMAVYTVWHAIVTSGLAIAAIAYIEG